MFRTRRQPEPAWIRVHQGSGPTEAYLVRDWLQRNGVPAQVRGEGLMSLRGEIPLGEAWPAVWAPEDRADEAATLIARFFGPTLVAPPWRCPRCDEENGPNFASCWSCGADRPLAVDPSPDEPTGG